MNRVISQKIWNKQYTLVCKILVVWEKLRLLKNLDLDNAGLSGVYCI